MADQPAFLLPPSPDELAESRQRDEDLARDRAKLREAAAKAWHLVPPTHDAQPPEHIRRCHEAWAKAKRDGKSPLAIALTAMTVPTLSALLLGPTGMGKSTVAASLVRRALHAFLHSDGVEFARATQLVWTTAAKISTAERRHPLGAGDPKEVTDAIDAGCLVLDDVGLDSTGAAVLQVLAERDDKCRPTIVTTGLTPEQLTDHLSAAGVRRLREQHAGFHVLVIDCHKKPAGKGRG